MSHKNIELEESKIKSLTSYRKSFGDEWVESALNSERARVYISTYLEVDKSLSNSSSPYRCYSEGTTVYRRKDGSAVSEHDLEAVRANRIGQVHGVYGEPGDDTIKHKWAVDSSG